MAKLVFGCGYLGLRVARLWKSAGQQVFAVSRSPQRAADLARDGIDPVVADVTSAGRLSIPAGVDTVLYSIGYDRSNGASIEQVYAGGLRRVLDALPHSVSRVIYISSTGVYGPAAGGEWVDEETPCHPTREGGKASLAAEHVLRDHPVFGQRAIILRLAGIYGLGRIPRSADLLAGKPIDAPATGWLNLIHVDDAASIVLLAEDKVQPPGLYAVSDGSPVIRGDYYRELARLLGAPEPSFIQPATDSPAAQRAGSDKRVDNRRLLAELEPTFRYASYRDGLAEIVSATH